MKTFHKQINYHTQLMVLQEVIVRETHLDMGVALVRIFADRSDGIFPDATGVNKYIQLGENEGCVMVRLETLIELDV